MGVSCMAGIANAIAAKGQNDDDQELHPRGYFHPSTGY